MYIINHVKLTNLTLFCIMLVGSCYAQKKKKTIYKKKLFQCSIVPSFGSNGLHPGEYINYFSFNLVSGYSAANHLFELAGISNLNEIDTKGIQIAGFTNITGGNAHAKMTPKEIAEEEIDVEHNLQGLQFSGFLNSVSNTVWGAQFTGGINGVGGALWGLQIAGLLNNVNKYSTGVQIAGLYNVSKQRMDGLQLSTLFNSTQGLLIGAQIGVFNKAGRIEGKNSYNNKDFTGIQIGVVNKSDKMNGIQIGLVNFGGTSQGTMIGLINIYQNGGVKDTKGATAFGLISAGDFGNLMVYADETFALNYQLNLGNSKNGNYAPAITSLRYWYNGLIFGHNPRLIDRSRSWTAGYSFGEYVYFPVVYGSMNKYRYASINVEVSHYNYGRRTNEKINPLLKLKVAYGSKVNYKLGVRVFGGLSYNVLFTNSNHQVYDKWLGSERENDVQHIKMWPGIFFGVHLH